MKVIIKVIDNYILIFVFWDRVRVVFGLVVVTVFRVCIGFREDRFFIILRERKKIKIKKYLEIEIK